MCYGLIAILTVVLSVITIGGSGCGSSQKVRKAELKPKNVSDDDVFVRGSPNQDTNTIVLPGRPAFPACEECTRRYSEMIHEIISAMCEGMAEGSIKGFFGVKQ
jgi:hypothetical protein